MKWGIYMIKIFDGAMGTMLQAAGLKAGACPDLMSVEQPDVVKAIHKKYLAAGSDFVTTNTFGATTLKLEHYGLSSRMEEINAAAVKAARDAIAEYESETGTTGHKVAGDIGPTGRFIEPLGDLGFEEAYEAFRGQAKALADAGADCIIIETSIDIQEMRAALLAAKDVTNLPVICQMTYTEDGRTVTGTSPEAASVTLEALGADAIGVNCSLGPEELVPIVKRIADSCSVPVTCQPNAGMPILKDGETVFPLTPADFARFVPALVEAGATYIGGCCGTNPEHIRAIKHAAEGVPLPERIAPKGLRLSSRTKTVTISKDLPTQLIGERINPTGRKKLAADIKAGSFASVKKEAIGQTRAGAGVLDVNMGVAGIDQCAAMKQAVTEIAQITDTPLAIDTSDAEALEAALRIYPGRALVNSVTAEPDRIEKFLPLAKKYGAAVLCLPITTDGVPSTAEERVKTEKYIISEAHKVGITGESFLLDSLVLTVSANENAANETLKTLRLYRSEIGAPSTMGLSNISFGLPARPLINSTFFAMALAAGLDAPIMNPYNEDMQSVLSASLALLGKDPRGIAFSKAHATAPEPAAKKPQQRGGSLIDQIKECVIDGEKEAIVPLVKQALESGMDTNEVTADGLTAAMQVVGDDFGAGRVFLPQVLLSAETMRAAFDTIKELIPPKQGDGATKGTVVLATVKGDVHDLGKNIVSALMENSGYHVEDLGKDVPTEDIVRAAIEKDADIVGLAALMTTTMTEIDKVIAALREAGSNAKVMVGGAAVTQDYADEAGADAYASDGVRAVKIADSMLGH